VFVVVNLENTSDVSIGFRTFAEIPVFLTAFSAFVFGMIFATPFAFSFGKKRKKTAPPAAPEFHHGEGEKEITGLKKLLSSRKKKKSANMDGMEIEPVFLADDVKKDKIPYGID